MSSAQQESNIFGLSWSSKALDLEGALPALFVFVFVLSLEPVKLLAVEIARGGEVKEHVADDLGAALGGGRAMVRVR